MPSRDPLDAPAQPRPAGELLPVCPAFLRLLRRLLPWLLRGGGKVGWAMEGAAESGAGAAGMLGQVDAVIRGYGMQPTAEVRSLLAAAAEQRMQEHGEPLSLAVQRAMALLAVSARRR